MGSLAIPLEPVQSHYGRARLWLGMTSVGTLVSVATLALLLDAPERLDSFFGERFGGQTLALLAFLGLYVALHVPFDVLGGYVLPKRHGRAHPRLRRFVPVLVRGTSMHAMTLSVIGLGLLAAGHSAGIVGTIGFGFTASLLLLLFRERIARTVAAFQPADHIDAQLPTLCVTSDDEGFTGGIAGVVRPRRNILPTRWRRVLGADAFALARRRRELAVSTGAWRRGRLAAIGFTWLGIVVAAFVVGSGDLGTARGIVELSLVFTVWSFVGLLVLPTLSRAGVAAVDHRLREVGADSRTLETSIRRLDELQDGETERPALVEAIFHPIPSVRNRLAPEASPAPRGFWDVARTAVYLSASGLGLLGRAVHCNCGRPALWVFLPSD